MEVAMEKFNLDKSIEILERTPSVLNSLLNGLSESWIQENEGENTWSPFDVVGHLIHGEKTDWITRTKIILEHGEEKVFTPFDRFAQFTESKNKNLNELLEEFEKLRKANLIELKKLSLKQEDLSKTGKHPEFGTVTLEQLLATWVVHDLNHIRQIVNAMANQYNEDTGPWKEYLSILKR